MCFSQIEVIKLAVHSVSELEDIIGRIAKKQRVSSINGLEIGEKVKVLDVVESEVGPSSGSSLLVAGHVSIGIPWTEDEFMEQATRISHPFDWEVSLPPKIAAVISHITQAGPSNIKRYRLEQLAYWRQREMALAGKEQELHARLHPDVEAVVASKRILLFQEMLAAIQYDDLAVVDLLITGVQVIGTLGRVGIWKPEDKAALISQATLLKGAGAAQVDATRVRVVSPEDEAIWNLTLEEVEEGCLDGPFSADEVTAKLGAHWVPREAYGSLQELKSLV